MNKKLIKLIGIINKRNFTDSHLDARTIDVTKLVRGGVSNLRDVMTAHARQLKEDGDFLAEMLERYEALEFEGRRGTDVADEQDKLSKIYQEFARNSHLSGLPVNLEKLYKIYFYA